MNLFSSSYFFILQIFIFNDYLLFINSYDFQCLVCDSFVDGPGCGEFTRQISVKACRTFCYFAVLYNHSSLFDQQDLLSSAKIRAIRDCSLYDDMSIEGNLLLDTKLISKSSSIEILTLKRCNSEQCNNDFYLQSDEFLSNQSPSYRKFSFPIILFVPLVIIFY